MVNFAIVFFGAIILGGILFVAIVAMASNRITSTPQQAMPIRFTMEQAIASADAANHSYQWHKRWFGEPDDERTCAVVLHGQTVRVHVCVYEAEGMMAVYTQDEDHESNWVWNCYAAISGPEVSTVDPIDEQLFMSRMAGRARNVRRMRRIQSPQDS